MAGPTGGSIAVSAPHLVILEIWTRLSTVWAVSTARPTGSNAAGQTHEYLLTRLEAHVPGPSTLAVMTSVIVALRGVRITWLSGSDHRRKCVRAPIVSITRSPSSLITIELASRDCNAASNYSGTQP